MAKELKKNERLFKAQNKESLAEGDQTSVEAWLLQDAVHNYGVLHPTHKIIEVLEDEAIGNVFSILSESGVAHISYRGGKRFTLNQVFLNQEQTIAPMDVFVSVRMPQKD